MNSSEYGTALAELRTLFAIERNALAEERTSFAELRTGLALLAITPSISAILTLIFRIIELQLFLLIGSFSLAGVGFILTIHAQTRLNHLRKRKALIYQQEHNIMQKHPDTMDVVSDLLQRKVIFK